MLLTWAAGDIAEYLLEHNARMDIFAATMLGQIDIVKAAVAAFPNIVNVPGPHGIPLIVHAEKGGAGGESRVGIFAAAYHSTVAPTMMKISSGKNRTVARALVVSFVSLSIIGITRANDTAKQVARIVAQIQHADFAGDQVAMQKGYDDLQPFLENIAFASRIRVLARLRSMAEGH